MEYLFQPAPTKGSAHLQTQGALCNLFSFVRCMRPFQRKRLYNMYTFKPLGNPNNHWNITRLLPVNIIKTLFNGYILFWTNRQSVLCTPIESMICLWYVHDFMVQVHRMLHLKSCLCICIRFVWICGSRRQWPTLKPLSIRFFLSSFENGTWKDNERYRREDSFANI